MSRLNELVKELCPNGVEYKKLGDVCTVATGEQLNKSLLTDNGEYPVYNGGMAPSGYWNDYNAESDTIIISQGGASAGYVNFVATNFWAGAHCYIVKPSSLIENKYLYYLLKNMQAVIQGSKIGAGIPGLNRQEILKLEVPLPPLKIQQEIVKILDKFTQMQAELQAELNLRLKQYEYYRDKLLCSFDTSKYQQLSNFVQIVNGKSWKGLGKGQVPVYGSGGVMTYVNRFAYDGPSVLLPRKGTIDKVYYLDEPFWNVDTVYYTKIDRSVIEPKFFYYFMTTVDLVSLSQNATRPSLTQSILNKIMVPVPPLSAQRKIIRRLDSFNDMTRSLVNGLPAEIKLRQQQYEYYRDKLLTFSPAN